MFVLTCTVQCITYMYSSVYYYECIYRLLSEDQCIHQCLFCLVSLSFFMYDVFPVYKSEDIVFFCAIYNDYCSCSQSFSYILTCIMSNYHLVTCIYMYLNCKGWVHLSFVFNFIYLYMYVSGCWGLLLLLLLLLCMYKCAVYVIIVLCTCSSQMLTTRLVSLMH